MVRAYLDSVEERPSICPAFASVDRVSSTPLSTLAPVIQVDLAQGCVNGGLCHYLCPQADGGDASNRIGVRFSVSCTW